MSREFDVVVYGATGFTGQYGSDVSWAMAGRSQDKLEAVRDEMGVSKDVALIVANSDKPETLAAMAARTKSVCTTVGPYQLYGDPLVGRLGWSIPLPNIARPRKRAARVLFTLAALTPFLLIWVFTSCNNMPSPITAERARK